MHIVLGIEILKVSWILGFSQDCCHDEIDSCDPKSQKRGIEIFLKVVKKDEISKIIKIPIIVFPQFEFKEKAIINESFS